MTITVYQQQKDRIFTFDFSPETYVEDIKALIEVETSIPIARQALSFGQTTLDDKAQLSHYSIPDDSLLLLSETYSSANPSSNSQAELSRSAAGQQLAQVPQLPPMQQQRSGQLSMYMEPEQMIKWLGTGNDREQKLRELDLAVPPLADALRSGNVSAIREVLTKMRNESMKRSFDHAIEELVIQKDPQSLEAQKIMENRIRESNVARNLEQALEETPESFTKVPMLYVRMFVNNHPLIAFVDSGAQNTIMSFQVAKKCGLDRLMDTRYQGVAMGVGQRKILGRVHLVEMAINSVSFPCTITILEDNFGGSGPEFLFGLDMLRKHQCIISLSAGGGTLTFAPSSPSSVQVPFLSEAEIARETTHDAFS